MNPGSSGIKVRHSPYEPLDFSKTECRIVLIPRLGFVDSLHFLPGFHNNALHKSYTLNLAPQLQLVLFFFLPVIVHRLSFISCELADSETQTDGGSENSSNASLTWKLGVSECIVAFLEDPSDYEVTTPGAFIKVSFELQ